MIALTKRVVDAAKAPAKGVKVMRDSEVMGFCLTVQAPTRLSPDGRKTFTFSYRMNGWQRRVRVGNWPTWNCEQARERARELRRAVDCGLDPAMERKELRERPTMSDLFERYERDWLPRKSAHSQREDVRTINTRLRPRLGKRFVSEVHHGDVVALHAYITKEHGPVRANRVVAVLSKCFSLAIVPLEGEARAWVTTNPVKGLERNRENSRERFFSSTELVAIGEALSLWRDPTQADAVRFIMATGCRPTEALNAKRADIDGAFWNRPASSMKARKASRIPLNAAARELIARRPHHPYLFDGLQEDRQSLRACWDFVRKTAKLGDGARLYDLRHTFASVGAGASVSLYVLGKLMGHHSPRSTQKYAHLGDDPLRDASDKIGAVIAPTHTAEVIALKR